MTIEYPALYWKDYELIDSGRGEKLERFGKYVLRRPGTEGPLGAVPLRE